MNNINKQYTDLLRFVKKEGEELLTRNSKVIRHYNVQPLVFNEVPLVTVRPTAWKKALLEMQWFMSGDTKCPGELLDWWKGQLNTDNCYISGYGQQLRSYISDNRDKHTYIRFDQIEWLINAIKHSPNSRRLIITTWHSEEMSRITEINSNSNTPTTCHLSFVQFFVSNGKLTMKSYNRSQDLLLGTPHNWIQHWALLMYLSHRTNLKVGSLIEQFGDAHIYREESHDLVSDILINCNEFIQDELRMIYEPTSDDFVASDFKLIGNISKPLTKIRPKLL